MSAACGIVRRSLHLWDVHLGYITRYGIFDTGKTKIAYLDPKDTDGILIELVESQD